MVEISLRTILVLAGLAFALSLAVNMYTVLFGVYPVITGGGLGDYGDYVRVYYVKEKIYPVTLDSTAGRVTVPVEGKVTVFIPQYVRCPDICHYETTIMKYLMLKLEEEGLLDEVVFVTVEVDPWRGTLQDAERYIRDNLEPLGVDANWLWLSGDDIDALRRLWLQLGVSVQRDPVTGLVQHTAGFYVVSRSGTLMYFIGPTSEGWKAPDRVADALYIVLKAVLEGKEIDPGHPLARLVIEGRP